MNQQALSGIRAIEIGERISGAYCCKLLSDFGAEVIKVERPAGDAARRKGPFPADVPHPEKSGLFLYLNTNKLGITLNLQSHTGRDIFKKLCGNIDIVVETLSPGWLNGVALGYNELKALNSNVIFTSISPFGQNGLYRDYKTSELVSFQMSGIGYTTPPQVKDTAKEYPLKLPEQQASFVAGRVAALSTLGAVYGRRRGGEGVHLDVSELESLVFLTGMNIITYTYEKKVDRRTGFGLAGLVILVPCKDGFVCMEPVRQPHWDSLVKLLGNPEWAVSGRFKDSAARKTNWDEARAMVTIWAKDKTKEQIVNAAQDAKIPVTPVNTPTDLLNSQQLLERGFFVDIGRPDTGEIKAPGAPFKLERTPMRLNRRAPQLGEHNEQIYCNRIQISKKELVELKQAGVI